MYDQGSASFLCSKWEIIKGLYASWKTWKLMKFYYFIFQAWKVMEFSWKVMQNDVDYTK